jgi:hypothetical protein
VEKIAASVARYHPAALNERVFPQNGSPRHTHIVHRVEVA